MKEVRRAPTASIVRHDRDSTACDDVAVGCDERQLERAGGGDEQHVGRIAGIAMNRIVLDSLLYGLLSFGAGFVLGAVRELLLIPALGAELGHWVEFPLVTLAVVAIAWRLVALRPGRGTWAWLAAGAIGVAALLALESTLALLVFGIPITAYLASFDVTQGALFPIGLAVMQAAPAVLDRLGRARGPR
jgi:hypothetical protein